jgi:UDP-N-acetylglucosamine 1-carboxyvinyltransferase
MAKFIIEGGRTLSGSVTPSGNKNEALPALFACLLTDQTVTLTNVPRIGDVLTICEIMETIGVKIQWTDDKTLTMNAAGLKSVDLPHDLCEKARASILFLGPLLGRFGKVNLPLPGGDVIGARRIDTHWEGIEALGADLKFGRVIEGSLQKYTGGDVYLDEPSVTATENLLLFAAAFPETTIFHNAACEPHVVGICELLASMGAEISGMGTNRISIRGSKTLKGTTHRIGPDFMEVGSFLCLGAIGGGKVEIKDVNVPSMRFILKVFSRLGINPEVKGSSLIIDGSKPLKMKKDVSGRVSSIYSGPWPAYPTDLMSVAIVASTQAHGTMIFFEKMFEGRMFFTDKLMAMGANIVLCDPHRIVVTGPASLYGARMSSPDVRAGMALVMAALVAQGTSEIDNIYQIERGYSGIEQKLKSLGASIERKA